MGKGELDHDGGVAKVAVRSSISAGSVFDNSKQIVTFLKEKFQEKESPHYHIKEMMVDDLTEAR